MNKLMFSVLFLIPTASYAADFAATTKRMDEVRSAYHSCLTKNAAYYGEKLCRDVSEIIPGAFGKCIDQRNTLEDLVRERGDAPSERTRFMDTLRESYYDQMTAIILDQQIAANCQPK